MQNTFSQSGNDSKWFLKKSFFKIGMWHSRPPPFMANTILNFHFDYRHTSLIITPNHCFYLEGPAHDIVSSGVQSHWKENWSKIRGHQLWCQLSWLVQKVRFDFPSIKFPYCRLLLDTNMKINQRDRIGNWVFLWTALGDYWILMHFKVNDKM